MNDRAFDRETANLGRLIREALADPRDRRRRRRVESFATALIDQARAKMNDHVRLAVEACERRQRGDE